MASNRRKAAAVAIAVVGIAGLSLAAAAQLNLNSSALGAASVIVASCQPTDDGIAPAEVAITTTYTDLYDATLKGYRTSAVVLSGVATACIGQTINVTVADTNGVSLGSGTVTAAAGVNTVTLSAGVDASKVARLAVVIAS